MSRRAAFVGALAALLAAGGARALELADDRGSVTSFERPAQRIVALAPHLAELAFAAGAGPRLVGVSAFSDFPEEARRLPVVFTYGHTDFERLVVLKPDAVLAWQTGTPALQVERLERLGFRVLVTEPRGFADIPRIMRLIGQLAGTSAIAEERARGFEAGLAQLRGEYAGRRPVRVFLEIWHQPMITVNGAHIFSEATELCGGRNIFAGAGTLTPLVSKEQLLFSRPEVIVTSVEAGSGGWKGLEALPAVQARRVYSVDPDLAYRSGPRLLEGARSLCRLLDRARG